MCCIVKYLLYLALVLKYIFHFAFSMCCIAEHTSYIWPLCCTTSLIDNVNVLDCKTPLIFGACLELLLSFDTANVLCCKKPLIFGASVKLRQLTTWMCCIVKYLLYLALVLNYVFHFAFSMCCIAEHLLYLALVLNYVFD